MILGLERLARIGDATIGRLVLDGEHACFTLEDVEREEKIPAHTAIPRGAYRLELRDAGRFHDRYRERWDWHQAGMLWLRGDATFESAWRYVYLHPGNHAGHTAGCILVGELAGPGHLVRSVEAYERLYPRVAGAILAGQTVELTIAAGALARPLGGAA
jgi:hypothetical protein